MAQINLTEKVDEYNPLSSDIAQRLQFLEPHHASHSSLESAPSLSVDNATN